MSEDHFDGASKPAMVGVRPAGLFQTALAALVFAVTYGLVAWLASVVISLAMQLFTHELYWQFKRQFSLVVLGTSLTMASLGVGAAISTVNRIFKGRFRAVLLGYLCLGYLSMMCLLAALSGRGWILNAFAYGMAALILLDQLRHSAFSRE